MTSEQLLRQALRRQANSHVVNTHLPGSTAMKARLTRAMYVAAAATITAAFVIVATAIAHLNPDPIQATGVPEGSIIDSGRGPDGSTWRLYSFSNTKGEDCFGLSAGRDDGSGQSCHAVPDDRQSWVHIRSARLTQGGIDAGGALFGEVSVVARNIKITLRSGKTVKPELIAAKRPYEYFVTLLDPNAAGRLAVYGENGRLIREVEFVLTRGVLED